MTLTPTGPATGPEPLARSSSSRTARLAELLESAPGRTVSLEGLWRMWAVVDPSSVGSPERRHGLARALEDLAEAELAHPSKTQDRSAQPHLPTRITLPAKDVVETAAELARATAWRPELAWVLRTRLTPTQVEHLRKANTWLRDHGRENDHIPVRERSLQILGHEKLLDRMLLTGVFGPGRLSLEMLRTFRTHPPLPSVKVGQGPVLLVVENDNTFHSLRVALEAEPGAVGYLAWGAGGAFEASVRSCGDLPGITRVRYFGDLDADGIRIPRNAAATATREGLPPVLAAHGLYRALLSTGVRQPHTGAPSAEQVNALVDWFDSAADAEAAAIGGDVSEVLASGMRVAQEALNLTALCGDRAWALDL